MTIMIHTVQIFVLVGVYQFVLQLISKLKKLIIFEIYYMIIKEMEDESMHFV